MATETETADGLSLDLDSLTPVHWVGVVLALVSAVIHLFLGASFAPSPLGVSFLMAGLGFLGALVLLAVGYRRRLLYGVGIPFTATQIAIWVALQVQGGGFPSLSEGAIAYVDKGAQVLLILVLGYLLATD